MVLPTRVGTPLVRFKVNGVVTGSPLVHGDGIGNELFFCDGDNCADDRTGKPRPPVLYTIQQISAAQPIAYVVVTAPAVQQPAVDWQAKYEAMVTNLEALIKLDSIQSAAR